MHLTERRLRSLIRALLEADAPGTTSSPSPGATQPMDAPIEKTEAEKAAERETAGTKGDFDDDLAELLAKKMKEKNALSTSIDDMKKAVKGQV